jgi:hypothetical protein
MAAQESARASCSDSPLCTGNDMRHLHVRLGALTVTMARPGLIREAASCNRGAARVAILKFQYRWTISSSMGLRWPLSICLVLAFLGLAACGDKESSSPARVQITSPSDGTVVRTARITVRGTVSPPDAAVQVLGRPAQVANSLFSSSVSLHAGTNDVDVVATAPGTDPTTTAVTVIRSKRSRANRTRPTVNTAPSGGNAPQSGGNAPPSGTSCGDGITAGPNTSCPFARNVVSAYRETGGGTVRVYSPVTRKTYSMSCTSSPPHVCTGANNASVYFP